MEYGIGVDRSAGGSLFLTLKEGLASRLALQKAQRCDGCGRAKPAGDLGGSGWGVTYRRANTRGGRRTGAAVLCGSCSTGPIGHASRRPSSRDDAAALARRRRLELAERESMLRRAR